MARKILSRTYVVEKNRPVNGEYITESLDISDMLGYAVQYKIEQVTGPIVASIDLLTSNYDDMPYESVPNALTEVVGATSGIIEVEDAFCTRLKVKVGYTSGEFLLTIVVSVKG